MRSFLCLMLATMVFCQPGCNKPTARVSGSVRYGGAPVTDATVMLMTTDNRVLRADLDANGKFLLEGVTQGPVKVAIQQALPRVPERPAPTGLQDSPLSVQKDGAPLPTAPQSNTPRLPERLGDANKSGLKFDLDKPEFVWSIDLPVE